MSDHPFALLGLEARTGLSDDDVRAAWRRIAAATHPDREDGGDPARFGAAAAAYVMLRTGFGRGEALADLGLGAATAHGGRHAHRRQPADLAAPGGGRHRARRRAPADRRTGLRLSGLTLLKEWISRRAATPGNANRRSVGSGNANWRAWGLRLRPRPVKHPGGLGLRVACAAAISVVAVVISGWSPGVIGVLAGLLTWLLVSAGQALARRRSQ